MWHSLVEFTLSFHPTASSLPSLYRRAGSHCNYQRPTTAASVDGQSPPLAPYNTSPSNPQRAHREHQTTSSTNSQLRTSTGCMNDQRHMSTPTPLWWPLTVSDASSLTARHDASQSDGLTLEHAWAGRERHGTCCPRLVTNHGNHCQYPLHPA